MAITAYQLAKARKFTRHALDQVFADSYPAVCRISAALTGRPDVARGVVRWVMARAMYMLPKWRDETAPERWFLHHTLLTARRTSKHLPDPKKDLLLVNAEWKDEGYPAFVRALRQLPVQQKEAFILHHGEHFNDRYLAVAMDCSTQAAENHLHAATAALQAISGDRFETFTTDMKRAYAKLGPTEEEVFPSVRKYVSRHLWPRRFKALVKLIVALVVLAAIGYAVWRYRRLIGLS
jgi:DNA-directed RNA polymerase specialized sigma24 family protein